MLTLFELVPLGSMMLDSLQSDTGNGFSLTQYYSIFSNHFYRQGMINSVLISLYSGLVGLLAGLAVAYAITRFAPRSRDLLLTISNMTSNFAGVPLAFAYIILLGNNGLFTLLFQVHGHPILGRFDLYSWTGLALVYAYFQIPLAVLLLYPCFYTLKPEWRESAELLGASSKVFWLKIGFPVIMPGILGTFSLLFANSMGAYTTAYALVGSNYPLITIQVSSLVAANVLTDPHQGSALGVILASLVMFFLWINNTLFSLWKREVLG